MAMLAEPRRKQKWSLNPRGKQWSEDSNKFGQKILEKMGWSSGKGLGANEQGMTEHVRVALKNDMGGIGFKNDDWDKAWTEHQDSFNNFLQQLQQESSSSAARVQENDSELSGKSLELKSKQSRARVHYQKFTRGKDVNKYSPKDLANIFGQKELSAKKKDKSKENDTEESSHQIGSKDNTGGVVTIHGGSMADYFKKKGKDFTVVTQEKGDLERDTESEPEYAGFGFTSTPGKKKSTDNVKNREAKSACSYAFENPCVQFNSPENSSITHEIELSKKRKSTDNNELSTINTSKKFKECTINENEYKNGIANAALNLECETNDELCNGKEFEVSRLQFGLTNTALDLSDETEERKRVRFNDHVEYSTDCTKKKTGRSMLDKFEVENKKAKKKKKHSDRENNVVSSGFVNEALDVEETPEEVHDNEVNERKSKKSKKRKGSRRSNLETIVETPEEEKETIEEEPETKRAKIENNVPDDSDVSSKKKKKKRKEKAEAVENKHDVKVIEDIEVISEVIELDQDESEIREVEENISKKKKKKKSKNKDIEQGVEETKFPENNSQAHNTIVAEDDIVELESIIVKKRKKSSKDDTNDANTKEVNTKDDKEVSDKENTTNADESATKKSKKKKYKKSVDEVGNNSLDVTECIPESAKEENTVACNTPESSNNERRNNTSSPWNRTARMPKRLLKSLFQRNSIQNFPGSNIHDIKGYGADI